MAAQALSQLVVGRFEEVLADVAQEMKMADEVPCTGKNLGHRLNDAGSHVMHTGSRGPIVSLDLSQEGNNVVGVLAGQLHIGENDLAQAVHTGHQRWSISFMGGIEMKDVTAGELHRLVDLRGCPVMPGGQESDELAPQIRDLGVRETYVFGNEPGADLLGGLVVTEQGFSHENQDIIAHIAATGGKPEKFLGVEDAEAGAAFIYRLVGNERPVHTQNRLSPRLLDDKLPSAVAYLLFGAEPDNRRPGEQRGRR